MAQDIKILRNDSYDLEFEIRNSNGELIPLASSGWNVMLESDYINKNSIDNPTDFVIETGTYTTGQGKIILNTTETNPEDYKRSPYKIRLYKTTTPVIVKTVVSGDIFFIDEAY